MQNNVNVIDMYNTYFSSMSNLLGWTLCRRTIVMTMAFQPHPFLIWFRQKLFSFNKLILIDKSGPPLQHLAVTIDLNS